MAGNKNYKENYSVKNEDRVTVLVLCTLFDNAVHLYYEALLSFVKIFLTVLKF